MTNYNKNKTIVGFINSCRAWGGGEKWHFEAARDLQSRGFNVVFFCEPGSEIETRLIAAGIPTQSLSIRNLSFLNFFKLQSLATRFKALGIETLILNSPSDVKLAGPAAKLARINNIIFRRGMPHSISNNFYNRWLFNSVVHRVIANSQAVADSLDIASGGIVPSEKISLIENGLSFDENTTVPPYQLNTSGGITLSTAGRMVRQKNQRFLIDVSEELAKRGLDFVLNIAGSGALESELKTTVAEKGLKAHVRFPGFVEHMHDFLATTDIFLFPSLYEGSPNTLIEAAGAGLAIVASDIPPNREILPNDTYGRLLQIGDTSGFCDAIEELAADAELRRKIGAAAKARVRHKFNLDNARDKLVAIL
jgi:glycosyltransferase involved in cell wall biosynthesis